MPHVYLSIGSNVEPRKHVAEALRQLEERFGPLTCSPTYLCPAVGFKGPDFHNLVVAFTTTQAAQDIMQTLKTIEEQMGRDRSGPKFSDRPIDIDLLLYGAEIIQTAAVKVPRDEILKYAFVLGPLADIAGETLHPQSQRSFADLWASFDAGTQTITRLD